jgi:hypothetical protein
MPCTEIQIYFSQIIAIVILLFLDEPITHIQISSMSNLSDITKILFTIVMFVIIK